MHTKLRKIRLKHQFPNRGADVENFLKVCRDAELHSEEQDKLSDRIVKNHELFEEFCRRFRVGQAPAERYLRSLLPPRDPVPRGIIGPMSLLRIWRARLLGF